MAHDMAQVWTSRNTCMRAIALVREWWAQRYDSYLFLFLLPNSWFGFRVLLGFRVSCVQGWRAVAAGSGGCAFACALEFAIRFRKFLRC